MEERRNSFRIISIIITVVVVGLAGFFGAQLLLRGGMFAKPGELVFDESVTEVVREIVEGAMLGEGVSAADNNADKWGLKHDVTVKASASLTKLPEDETRVLYNILLPVTDFYHGVVSITTAEMERLINPTGSGPVATIPEAPVYRLVSVWDLRPTERLVAVDGNYYLDTLSSGAQFEYLEFTGEDAEEVKEVARKVAATIDPFPGQAEVLTLAQTGVTALSRGMNAKLQQLGGDAKIFAANIGEFLSGFDLTHTSNESSFSQLATAKNICSNPAMIETLTAIGLDIVELTGNHNQDCGDNDAIATIDKYQELGIRTVGGGKTAAEAAIPLEIQDKGAKITMLAYNYSTGGYTLDNTPGANFYTEEKAAADIAAAKERGDFVIVDIQFFECNEYANTSEDTTCDYANSSAGDQIGFFRHLVDLGADIVVGTSAHQPQTFEIYRDKEIYYGLGNLFFDQSWWPGTTRSLILVHYFYEGALLQTRIVPTVYDSSYQTKLMEETDARAFIERLAAVRPA